MLSFSDRRCPFGVDFLHLITRRSTFMHLGFTRELMIAPLYRTSHLLSGRGRVHLEGRGRIFFGDLLGGSEINNPLDRGS